MYKHIITKIAINFMMLYKMLLHICTAICHIAITGTTFEALI